MKSSLFVVIVAACVFPLTVGCGDDGNGDPGVPNPAAVFCEKQGGTTSGPEPMCKLPDGSVVDAWEYFRAENPAG
jgi:putative hemolysin